VSEPCKPYCDITKAKFASRATWLCVKCKKDISLAYLLCFEAIHGKKIREKLAEFDAKHRVNT
jgi:hypothetical protein